MGEPTTRVYDGTAATKTRLRLLAAAAALGPHGHPRIYREAGQYYDAALGVKVSDRVQVLVKAGWLAVRDDLDVRGKTPVLPSETGRAILAEHQEVGSDG